MVTDIVELMKKQPNFYAMKGASNEEIQAAEQALALRFAPDYRKYVATFGAASFSGHELTGVCKSKRLNVVAVTAEEKGTTPNVKADWYVVEQANIDGIVVWQASDGTVYETRPNSAAKRISSSLAGYIDS